jgi:hypothetical protein
LAAQIYLDTRTDADAIQLAEAIGFGLASFGLWLRQIQLALLDAELAAAAEERQLVDSMAEA